MAENKQEETSKQENVTQTASENKENTATKSASTGTKSTKPKKPKIVSASKVEGAKDGKVTIKKDADVAEHIIEDPDEAVIVVNADHEETKASKQLANTLRNAYGQIQARKSNKAKEAAEKKASEEAARAKEAEEKLKLAEEERLKAEAEAAAKAEEAAKKASEEEKQEKTTQTEEVKENEEIEEPKEDKKKSKKNEPPKNFAELMSVLSDLDDEEEEQEEKVESPVEEEPKQEGNENPQEEQYAGYALADDYKQSLEEEQINAGKASGEQIEEPKKPKKEKPQKRVKNTKKDGEYKPPFYQNFKFWVIVVAALCFVGVVAGIIISTINNSRSNYPKGFIFETQQNGKFTQQSEGDLFVYNTVSQTNGVRVRVSFDGNFSGRIEVRVGQTGIAEIDGAVDNKKIISNGETITIKPKYLEGTGLISEAVGGLTYIEARYDTVYTRMNILFDKQLSDITISAKMSESDEQALRGYERKYYVSRELTLEAETYYGQFSPGYKADAYGRTVYWTSSNPNIASVDSEGRVTSYRAGTVEFYARAQEYYSPDNTTTLKRNSQKFEITFSDIPVESIMLRGGDDAKNFSLWLSDPEALTIDLKECVDIATDGKKAPLNFSADYLYENAVLDYFTGYEKVDVNISKNEGGGVFKIYDTETSHEGKTVYINVKFGDDPTYWLNTADTNHPIKVDIKRSKNYVVKLRDRTKDSANIEFLSFDNVATGQTVLYTNSSLLNLFDLEIAEAINGQYNEEKTVNNFIASRDIAFVAEDKFNNQYYELQFNKDSGYWYFVPLKDCLTAAIVDGDGFAIRAYLKDINTKDNSTIDGFARITGSESDYLTIKVIAPNASSNSVLISGQSAISNATYNVSKAEGTLNLYDTFLTAIANNRADSTTDIGLSRISISGATNSNATINYSDLFSVDNKPTAKHVYLKLTSRNDSAIYVGRETLDTNNDGEANGESFTKVGLNDNAVIGSVHYLTLEFRYIYDIDLIETGRPAGSNEEVIKSLTIRIKVTA